MGDLEAISAGIKLIQKAAAAIQRRKYSDLPGSRWRVPLDFDGMTGTPEYVGAHGKAWLCYTEDGQAYEVCTFTYAGARLHAPVRRKGLDAAFRAGERLANTPAGGE